MGYIPVDSSIFAGNRCKFHFWKDFHPGESNYHSGMGWGDAFMKEKFIFQVNGLDIEAEFDSRDR